MPSAVLMPTPLKAPNESNVRRRRSIGGERRALSVTVPEKFVRVFILSANFLQYNAARRAV